MLVLAQALGPLTLSPAVASWLLLSPLSRRALLRRPLLAVAVAAAVSIRLACACACVAGAAVIGAGAGEHWPAVPDAVTAGLAGLARRPGIILAVAAAAAGPAALKPAPRRAARLCPGLHPAAQPRPPARHPCWSLNQ
jgi:hypothetical protein